MQRTFILFKVRKAAICAFKQARDALIEEQTTERSCRTHLISYYYDLPTELIYPLLQAANVCLFFYYFISFTTLLFASKNLVMTYHDNKEWWRQAKDLYYKHVIIWNWNYYFFWKNNNLLNMTYSIIFSDMISHHTAQRAAQWRHKPLLNEQYAPLFCSVCSSIWILWTSIFDRVEPFSIVHNFSKN